MQNLNIHHHVLLQKGCPPCLLQNAFPRRSWLLPQFNEGRNVVALQVRQSVWYKGSQPLQIGNQTVEPRVRTMLKLKVNHVLQEFGAVAEESFLA